MQTLLESESPSARVTQPCVRARARACARALPRASSRLQVLGVDAQQAALGLGHKVGLYAPGSGPPAHWRTADYALWVQPGWICKGANGVTLPLDEARRRQGRQEEAPYLHGSCPSARGRSRADRAAAHAGKHCQG